MVIIIDWSKGVKCKDTKEVCYSYKEYLNSKHWITFRYNFFKKVSNQCRMCQCTQGLNLHHKTYKNIGNEKIEDVVGLCFKCHKYIHNNVTSFDTRYLFDYGKNKKDTKIKTAKKAKQKPKPKPKKRSKQELIKSYKENLIDKTVL